MQITDPIADMLTRIRNAGNAGHESCDIPASNIKKAIARILVDEGYLEKVEFQDDQGPQGNIKVTLKYHNDKNAIKGLKRISRPGLRVYANAQEMPKVLGGLGIALVSTSQGVMTDKQARAKKTGGEVLAYIW